MISICNEVDTLSFC